MEVYLLYYVVPCTTCMHPTRKDLIGQEQARGSKKYKQKLDLITVSVNGLFVSTCFRRMSLFSLYHVVMKKVMSNFNMLCSEMLDEIVEYFGCYFIITLGEVYGSCFFFQEHEYGSCDVIIFGCLPKPTNSSRHLP